ncbi:unnamed protein product [Meganyctiphanes norvegica]|uniref:ShKT domain-containing protein n=1 Tax=Meganyctiphanes norvegica TaxID=48144 RepID=A0AAV2QZ61_MEGNR
MKFWNVVILVITTAASAALDRRTSIGHWPSSSSSSAFTEHSSSASAFTEVPSSSSLAFTEATVGYNETDLYPYNQCLTEDGGESVLWRKVDSTGNGIKEACQYSLSSAATNIEATFNSRMDYAIMRIEHLDCRDWNEHCGYWAGIGECQRNPGYMLRMCPKSCNICDCYDKYEECPYYRDWDLCNNSPEFMLRVCPVTCGDCVPLSLRKEGRISGKPISPPAPISSTTAPKIVAT